MNQMMTNDNGTALTVLETYVSSELAYEWQRKNSFETRAFAVVIANLGLVTLSVAIGAQTRLFIHLSSGLPHILLISSLLPVALSLASAVLAALPSNYPAPTSAAVRALYDRMKGDQVGSQELTNQIVRARMGQLEIAVISNKRKSTYTIVAFAWLALAVTCFSASLVLAFAVLAE